MSHPATVRARAVVGLAFAQLRRAPGRTVLATLAVALAVLSVTLLASLGVGVVETGEDGLDGANRDIWVSSDPDDPSAGGSENAIVGSHRVAAEMTERDDVSSAAPLAAHEIYVGNESGGVTRTSAVGVHQTHDGFGFEAGGGFETEVNRTDEPFEGERNRSAGAVDGYRPDEPTTEEVVLDPDTAAALDVSVGDTVTLGGSRETAHDHTFTVVGIAAYYSQFLGSSAEAVPLFDLQAVTGTAGTDRATFITVSVEDDADPATVAAALDEEYPAYDVRTNDDQIRALFEDRPLVLASGATLVGVAFLGGLVLTINLFALVTYQQRDELAALRALGVSRWVLAGTVGVQGMAIGLVGGVVGLLATPPLTLALNRLAASIAGLDGLLVTPVEVYGVGFALALVVGTTVAVVTGWRAGRFARIEHLDGQA